MKRPSSTLVLSLLFAFLASLIPVGAAQTYVELILDASGSMFNKLDDGRYRIVAAKEVLADLIATLPEDDQLNVGLRVYGSSMRAIEDGACQDSVLKVPLGGFDRQLLLETVRTTQALGATPIAYSLEQAAQDFPAEGRKLIVLITDGEESCRSDLREVVEGLRAAGLDIDLRIIGFDLDEAALRSFEGLGTLENARSAAELLAALTRAVDVAAPAEVATYPVGVTLTREGESATDGPVVEFIGAVDEVVHVFTAAGDGRFTTQLPAGSYTARVSDAFSEQPLLVGGLAVVAQGANEFAFELAPAVEVTLQVADGEHVAGSTTSVAFEGAPDGHGWLAIAPADAGDDLWLASFDVEGPAGEAEVTLPDEAGDYEVRYLVGLPDGGTRVLGREAIAVAAAEATLDAPDEVPAGSRFEVHWTGPDNARDSITIVAAGAPEGHWAHYADTVHGNPAELQAPDVPGEYELRYLTGSTTSTLASRGILVTATSASLEAPEEVPAGSRFEVHWTGPDNVNDSVTIVPAGAPEGEWDAYDNTVHGNPLELRAPDLPGEYELRYLTGSTNATLARRAILVTETSATLTAPAEVLAGSSFEVEWTGPGNVNDYITIVPVGTAEGEWVNYTDASAGNPLAIQAPDEPGDYELRYVTGGESVTLARLPMTVTPATATVQAPASVAAGEWFTVTWEGPANQADLITIVPVGAEEGDWGNYADTSSGSPVELQAPEEPGRYEVRYRTGQSGRTLHSVPITVR